MASLTRATWVWASSGTWRWTGRPGVLQSTGIAKSWTRLSNCTKLNWSCDGSRSVLSVWRVPSAWGITMVIVWPWHNTCHILSVSGSPCLAKRGNRALLISRCWCPVANNHSKLSKPRSAHTGNNYEIICKEPERTHWPSSVVHVAMKAKGSLPTIVVHLTSLRSKHSCMLKRRAGHRLLVEIHHKDPFRLSHGGNDFNFSSAWRMKAISLGTENSSAKKNLFADVFLLGWFFLEWFWASPLPLFPFQSWRN